MQKKKLRLWFVFLTVWAIALIAARLFVQGPRWEMRTPSQKGNHHG